jgi:endoglucanase
VNGTHLVDEKGANVQLKGVSSQWLNLEKDGYALSLDALVWMRDNWKLTVFRAAMGAETADKEPGYTTNAAAQAEMQRQVEIVIKNAITAGVYVIVDWHAHNALSEQAAAVAFFGDLSKRYGQYPNVIFETFNEPLQVKWLSALKPYHEAVVKAIRDNDPDPHDNIVILGTPQWDQMPTDAAASPLKGDNLMYTVHFYSCTHNANSATPPPFGDGISHLQRAKDAFTAGLPIFVTEWGATKADGGVGGTAVCASEADGWHEWMNANQISWAAWKLDDCDTETPPDTSCLLKVNAPLNGGWDDQLNGHGPYVVGKLKN